MKLTVKRVYEMPDKSDGYRTLVDRLWPRGLSKEKAKVDLWLKDIAPSTKLRKWFAHDSKKWEEFKKRYKSELKENKESVSILKKVIGRRNVTLLYGAKDETHNEALVLLCKFKRIS